MPVMPYFWPGSLIEHIGGGSVIYLYFYFNRNLMKPCLLLLLLSCTTLSAQWVKLNGPDGGSAQAFAEADGKIFASVGKTCYSTIDEGNNWAVESTFPFYTLKLAAGENGVLFATQEQLSPDWAFLPQVALWRQKTPFGPWINVVDTADFELKTERILSIQAEGQTVLVGTNFNLYYSFDQGDTWARANAEIASAATKIIHAVNDVWFVKDGRRILRSLDDGANWDIVFQNATGIYDISWSGTYLYGFYKVQNQFMRSATLGDTWAFNEIEDLVIYTGANDDVSLTSRNDSILLTTSGGCIHGGTTHYLSYDQGNTWHHFNNVPSEDNVSLLHTFGNTIFSNTYLQGISTGHFSTGHLEASGTGIEVPRAEQLFVFQDVFWVVTTSGLWRSGNHGNSWEINLSWDEHCQSGNTLFVTGGRLFLFEPYLEKLHRYNETLHIWEDVIHPATMDGSEITGTSTHLFASYADNAWYSEDAGQTWIQIQNLPFDYFSEFSAFDSLLLVRKYNSDTSYFSTDAGQTWQPYIDPRTLYRSALLVSDGQIYFQSAKTTLGYFQIGNSSVEYFSPIFSPTGDTLELYGTFFKDTTNTLWLTHPAYGILFSADMGRNWHPFYDPLAEEKAHQLFVNEHYIMASTAQGVMLYNINQQIQWPENQTLDLKILPNPNTGIARLTCSGYIGVNLNFSMFNATGHLINSLTLPPGEQWDIDLSDLSNGSYFGLLKPLDGNGKNQFLPVKWIKM